MATNKMGKSLGVDIGGSTIRVGLFEGDELLKLISKPLNATGEKEELISFVLETISELFTDEVISIGIGAPDVDVRSGVIYSANNIPSWDEVPLKDLVAQRFGVEVFLNNDANCFVLSEKYSEKGKALDYENVVGLITGTGFGAGLIINGRLYVGANGFSGEFGDLPYLEGRIEDYVSGNFFTMNGTSGEDVYERALENHSNVMVLLERYAEHIANAIAMVVAVLDPEMIVIGGGLSKLFMFYKDSMKVELKKLLRENVYDNLKIEVSEVEDAGVIGANLLSLDL